MIRRILSAVLATVVLSTAAYAGDADKHGDMGAMMKEMEKCLICKDMAPHMATIMPVMKMEKADLNNGFVMITTIGDPKVLATYHSTCEMMNESGAKAMTMSADEAKTGLCPMCQGIYSFVHAGGNFSTGKTMNGDIMVFTTDNPEMKEQLDGIASMFSMMTAH